MEVRFLDEGLAVTGRYTAFSNNKKMVTILHRKLEQSWKSSAHEFGGLAAEDQKQYEFPAWINHNWLVQVNCLWRNRFLDLIYQVGKRTLEKLHFIKNSKQVKFQGFLAAHHDL